MENHTAINRQNIEDFINFADKRDSDEHVNVILFTPLYCIAFQTLSTSAQRFCLLWFFDLIFHNSQRLFTTKAELASEKRIILQITSFKAICIQRQPVIYSVLSSGFPPRTQ